MKYTVFILPGVLLIFILCFFSCSEEISLNNDEVNTYETKEIELNQISDNDLITLANSHNDYLEEIIRNFDYKSSNYYLELKRSFLNSDLRDLSLAEKKIIINSIEERHIKDDTIASILTTNDLIHEIQMANFHNKDKMIDLIQKTESKIKSIDVSYNEIEKYIDERVIEANQALDKNEQLVINSYLFTLKASAYFWFPSDLGGSGIGYQFLKRTAEEENRRIPWYGMALISDASSVSIGMVAICFVPGIGTAALVGVAAQAAVNSALGGLISWGTS